MAEVSQEYKYVKLDDGVSFSLVRTNPKLTTNTKLMYNGKKMYMESYASSPLMNRTNYKNVLVRQNSTYNKDIARFLTGSGSQAYSVYQNFSDITISDSYDNQFETMYWCGAEYIDSSFYTEEIGFVAPLYLREKLPNYFLIFRLDTPSNYNLNIDSDNNILDSTFNFKEDILDKAVLIKTFDLREGTPLGNYIHNYIEQEGFEFDKSMFVNFSNAEVTYYGINKFDGVLKKKVESFENELLKNDNPIFKDDKWFTEGFERNGLIFPYIMNIEYLFDDENFKDSYDFARYIGLYCNNIEFGEFDNLQDLLENSETDDNVIYYFEDINNNLHRYTKKINGDKYQITIDGKNIDFDEETITGFDKKLITGYEKERITGYAEPLDIYEGFTNRAQYGFKISKPLEPGDWIGIEYDGYVECYFADDKSIDGGEKYDSLLGVYGDFRFAVSENSSLNDIAKSFVKCVNRNKKSKFEARYSDNFIVINAKKEDKEYNNAKILIEESLIDNKKVFLFNYDSLERKSENIDPIENISETDMVISSNGEKSVFGDYYIDYFCGACNADIDIKTDTYKNVFKIYAEEYVFFSIGRFLKTKNGGGRKITTNMIYVNAEGNIDNDYRIVIVEDDLTNDVENDVSVSSTYQVEILDIFKPNHGVLSWFPVKDFDFDINYSTYGQYDAFADECSLLSKKVIYRKNYNTSQLDGNSNYKNSVYGLKELAKSHFFDDYGNYFNTEYDYYYEQIHPDLCIISKTTPYILKWGYYDEQKDSCENPYRLNISKIFGTSNLSSNTYLINCNESEYTHSMPYYMTMDTPNYNKEYQYIESNETYKNSIDNKSEQYIMNIDDIDGDTINSNLYLYEGCVNYWINTFMDTDVDMFSYFFSGKKYGKRFDRKYSRVLGGNKFHNPSTLFRGVKFEVVRQYNGVEKRSSEYNNYKFSFIYIPVMINSIVFNSTVYFVKNDTFKFIVGIIFVNTMLGAYNHNIFNGNIDYFKKGFIYAACKDIIRPESNNKNTYNLTLTYIDTNKEQQTAYVNETDNEIWDTNQKEYTFYMWKDNIVTECIFVTKENVITDENIIGEFTYDTDDSYIGIKKIIKPQYKYTLFDRTDPDSTESYYYVKYDHEYPDYDTTICRFKKFTRLGEVKCVVNVPNISFTNITFDDVCYAKWVVNGDDYTTDVSNISFKSESLQNILINIAKPDSVVSLVFKGNIDNNRTEFYQNDIEVDIETGNIKLSNIKEHLLVVEDIVNLKIDIVIRDDFDNKLDSVGFKNYFSVFNQISTHSILESINNDYNIKYYSTVEDNKYKVRIVEPDSIEIVDKYEAIPVKITQNNKSVVGSVEIKEKTNIDRIGKKVINRYSGYYNPIFNDILYYGDFTYTKNISKLRNMVEYELPYSNTNIDYTYSDGYGEFGVIKNMYFHKTNTTRSNKILTSEKPIYPAINEYALDYKDYNIFSSSWDDGYFISQEDLDTRLSCFGIGSMKEGMCMFGSKYLNLPDDIFIDTFVKGELWDDTMVTDIRDNTGTEIMYKEINNSTVRYHLFIEKRLKRYLVDSLIDIFDKYINKEYSFGDKETIYDDVEEYVEKNLLKLYKVDKVYLYIKSDRMGINNRMIENEYLEFMDKPNNEKIVNGFPVIDGKLTDSKFIMSRVNEFDRIITYNLNRGFKESFGIGVSIKRK